MDAGPQLSTSPAEGLPVRAMLLSCDGLFQRFLAARTATEMTLVGWVIQRDPERGASWRGRLAKLLRPVELFLHLLGLWVMRREQRGVRDLLDPVRAVIAAGKLDCEQRRVGNINDPQTLELIERLQPDIVLVNGTRLIRQPLLESARKLRLGMINLHTGLSPYARGGNCNLHLLREGQPELVGVTVHHLDSGIDSGDLILTSRPSLLPGDTFERIDSKVFLLGIDLMMKAVRLLHLGQAPRVPQWTDGKLFLVRTGYGYRPWFRFEVYRALKRGMVADYLADRHRRDAGIRMIGQEHSS